MAEGRGNGGRGSRGQSTLGMLRDRLGREAKGLVLAGAALLLASGVLIERRGLVHDVALWLRALLGHGVWFLVGVLALAAVQAWRGRPVTRGPVGLLAWLGLFPVVCGLVQAVDAFSGLERPGGDLGWAAYEYLACLTSTVSAALVLIICLLLLSMLATDQPLSEIVDAPGRLVLAGLSAVLFAVWAPVYGLHRAVLFVLMRLHRVVYWILEDLSAIGDYLTKVVFARRRWTTGRRAFGAPVPEAGLQSPAVVAPPPAAVADQSGAPAGAQPPQVEATPASAAGAQPPDPSVNHSGAPASRLRSEPELPPPGLPPPAPPPLKIVAQEGGDEEGYEEEEEEREPEGDVVEGDDEEEGADAAPEAGAVVSEEDEARFARLAQRPGPDGQLRLCTDPMLSKVAARGRTPGATPEAGAWRAPALDLFDQPGKERTGEDDEAVRRRGQKLIETLAQFKIEAEIVGVVRGPTITQYQIKPASGVKLSKITALSDNLAMALPCRSVRIEAPIPGKSAVGIEVPNEHPASVLFSEIVASPTFSGEQRRSKLSFALGVSIGGQPIVADLAKMPHLLVAGTTGSGKSVCINTILASILFGARPDEVRVLMVDPKMVELVAYNDIPHLVTKVVTNPTEAATALRWAVLEMERRYQFLSRFGVRNIEGYNRQLAAGELYDEEGEPLTGDQARPMPYMVIIIDELADLMMVAAKEIEGAICRLAQMARAVGMHLVVATQRPSTNVITGVIKANFPSRIAFAVSSKVDSKVILDCMGAEKLLGRGDMLYHPVGAGKPVRLQGAFISEEEVKRLVTFLKANGETDYVDLNADLVEEAREGAGEAGGGDSVCNDEMWAASVRLAVDLGDISTSLLQRHLNIGYNRAARIVDAMFERGMVSGQEAGRRRKVLISKEQVDELIGGRG